MSDRREKETEIKKKRRQRPTLGKTRLKRLMTFRATETARRHRTLASGPLPWDNDGANKALTARGTRVSGHVEPLHPPVQTDADSDDGSQVGTEIAMKFLFVGVRSTSQHVLSHVQNFDVHASD